MATFAAHVKEANVSELHRVVTSGGDKYLCYTRVSVHWTVCVTDGVSLWKADLDEEEVEALRDMAAINTVDTFFTRFRNGMNAGDISIALIGTKATLAVGKGGAALNFDLYEAKAAEKRTEMQNVLFRLAESATSLQGNLNKANQMIDALKVQKGGGNAAAFKDLGPKQQNAAKAKPKKTGMSVLNPTSKKRKAAHGVVFD